MAYLELDKVTGATVLNPGKKPRRKKVKSFIAWQGASLLDGKPIALLVIRAKGKANEKTGAMVQTYILRADVSPLVALKTGDDFSICGDCKHGPKNKNRKHGKGVCYVQVQNAPTGIYKAFVRGAYPTLTLEEGAVNLTGSIVRVGSYGDPSAVPASVWSQLLAGVTGKTGYTHQWKNAQFSELKNFCMASCDNLEEHKQALAMGWRSFLVVPKGYSDKVTGAFLCPASEEGGKKLNCIDCLACDGVGKRTASVYIPVHGVQFKQTRFNDSQLIQIGKL